MEQRTDKFLVYIEEFDILKELSDEEIGRFFRALIEFVRTGETPVLDEKLIFAFRFVTAHILRDQKKYREVSEKRSIAGKKGQEVKHLKNAEKEHSQSYDENEEREILQSDSSNEGKKLTMADVTNEKEVFQTDDEASEKDYLQANDESCEMMDIDGICGKTIKSNFLTDSDKVTRVEKAIKWGKGDYSTVGGKDGFSTLGEILSTCINKGFSTEGEKSGNVEAFTDVEKVTRVERAIKGGVDSCSKSGESGVNCGKADCSTGGEMVEKDDFFVGRNKKGKEKRECLTKKFDEFWERYPQKKNKKTALKAYFDLNPTEELHEKILEALESQKKTAEWTRDNGRFVPHPAKWITCRRWEDCYKKDDTKNKSESTFDLECSFDVDEFYKAAFEKSQRERGKLKIEN